MFKIGEFAQIGRVSGRQLRHYDRLGLLQPRHSDPQTGYRYYSAAQLPRLNRILALKALGFTLDQIGRMIDDELPGEELRGMLTVRRAQVEQALAEEQLRLREIEARILQIEQHGALRDYDVVLRSVAAAPYLSLRHSCQDMDEAVQLLRLVVTQGSRQVKARSRDKLVIVAHADFEGDELDLEFGFTLRETPNARVTLSGDLVMVPRELEAVETMAALVRSGPAHQSHLAYGALGVWMEANNYRIDGLCREVFLELPFADPASEDSVMEIQFPVRRAA
jgi:DNA-binding transcriptional MerR regulator